MRKSWTVLPVTALSMVTLVACSAETGSVGSISASTTAGGGGTEGNAAGQGAGGSAHGGAGGKASAGAGGNTTSGGLGGSSNSGHGGSLNSGQGGSSPVGQGGADSAGAAGVSAAGAAGATAGGGARSGGTSDAAPCTFPALPCSAQEIAAPRAVALAQPIIPPRYVAGIDLIGSDGKGTPAEEIDGGYRRGDYQTPALDYPGGCIRLCQNQAATEGALSVPAPAGAPTWPPTDVTLTTGYEGVMTMVSRPDGPWGAHVYLLGIGKQITRDGTPLVLPWDDVSWKDSMGIVSELYDAAVHTFAPYLPPLDGKNSCYVTGYCQLNAVDPTKGPGGPYWWAPALGIRFETGTTSLPGLAASTLTRMIISPLRELAYSRSFVKLGIGAGFPSPLPTPSGQAPVRARSLSGRTSASFSRRA